MPEIAADHFPRFTGPRLLEAIGDAPAVLMHGVGGVVLYDGETAAGFGDRMHAVPLRLLWEPSPGSIARGRR